MSNKIGYKFTGVKSKQFITIIGSSMPIVEVKNKIIKNLNLKQTHYRSLTVLDYHTAKGKLNTSITKTKIRQIMKSYDIYKSFYLTYNYVVKISKIFTMFKNKSKVFIIQFWVKKKLIVIQIQKKKAYAVLQYISL